MTNDITTYERSRSDWETLIDEWTIGKNAERDRKMLKMSLLDGKTYEVIAELLGMSPRQVARIIPKRQAYLFKHIK